MDRFLGYALLAWLCGASFTGLGASRVLVIGDSLSAEYASLPDVPGVDNPTEYARITVPGWESMSWVEVLGKLRPSSFGFGRYRADLPGWPDLRFSGYELNFAIPGFTAANYADIVQSSLFSDPQFFPVRLALEKAIKEQAKWVVIGLGANEFRANYGTLYNGGDPAKLISNLMKDLGAVVDFVQEQKSTIPIVLLNLPDLGATPAKKSAHPNATRRARVSAATIQANRRISELAKSRDLAVADIFAQTQRSIREETAFFGSVPLINQSHADNHPRYEFTRDGLHPNTCSQLEMARSIIAAFNTVFETRIPQIKDSEALAFLKINPNQAYFDWAARSGLKEPGMLGDPDQDGLANLAEYAWGTDPLTKGAPPMRFAIAQGILRIIFRADPDQARHVQVWPQWSLDLKQWQDLPPAQVSLGAEQWTTGKLAGDGRSGFIRLRISVLAPD